MVEWMGFRECSSEVAAAAAAAEAELPSQNISHRKGLEAISILLACHAIHWVLLSIPHRRDQEL
jgi:hypothetical protein